MRRGRAWALAMIAALALGSGAAAPRADIRAADRRSDAAAPSDVDVELVLAVDVSFSMDPDEQALQRDGYREALTSGEFLGALRQGTNGRIAVTYVEWAGANDQKVVMPWRLIDGPAGAQAVADEIGRQPTRRAYRTSISGGLLFAAHLFEESAYHGLRRVIDVSGDGTNNQGQLVTVARDEVVARGITVNGLPIMLKAPEPGSIDIADLDIYYEDCVIGGPAAFVVPIRERARFKDAVRTKLVLEIAGPAPVPLASPHTPLIPADAGIQLSYLGLGTLLPWVPAFAGTSGARNDSLQAGHALAPRARVIRAAAAAPRISCTIGERMWQQRWGRDGFDFK